MRDFVLFSSSVVVSLLLSGCGAGTDIGSASAGATGLRCDVPLQPGAVSHHVCYEYPIVSADSTSLMRDSCTNVSMGTIVDACPSQNLLGTCTAIRGPVLENPEAALFYSDGGLSQSDAQRYCTLSLLGTWTAM
jgi:hypothetical protein